MKPFAFDEETILFAKHVDLVEEMRARYGSNLLEFFGAIAERLAELESLIYFSYLHNGSSVYYSSKTGSGLDTENGPVVWCAWNIPAIVLEHRLTLTVTWAKGSDEERRRVAALADHPDLADITTRRAPTVWRLFDVQISWQPNEDPVSAVIVVLHPLLRLLYDLRPDAAERT